MNAEPTAGSVVDRLERLGRVIRARDASDVLTIASQILGRSPAQSIVWRGQADAEWTFTPSIYRRFALLPESSVAINPQLLRNARDRVILDAQRLGYVSNDEISAWAKLQHYGVATHLLDVTRDDRAGMWFAAQDRQFWGKDGVLFGINTAKLPTAAPNGYLDAPEVAYVKASAESDRIKAQRGGFLVPRLIFGDERDMHPLLDPDEIPSEEQAPTPFNPAAEMAPQLFALIIPGSSKMNLLDILEASGMNSRFMYPDFAGFCAAEAVNSPIDRIPELGLNIYGQFNVIPARPCIIQRTELPEPLSAQATVDIEAWLAPYRSYAQSLDNPPIVILNVHDGWCTASRYATLARAGELTEIATAEDQDGAQIYRGMPIVENSVSSAYAFVHDGVLKR